MIIALLPSFCVDRYDYLAPYNQLDDVVSFTQLNSDNVKDDESDGFAILHYISGIFTSTAGMVYGANSVVGGAGALMSQCFTEGTVVKTEDGDKTIEDIEEGDKVISINPVTGEKDLKEVTKVYRNETDRLIHLMIQNEKDFCSSRITVDTTPDHPFYVVGYGFK